MQKKSSEIYDLSINLTFYLLVICSYSSFTIGEEIQLVFNELEMPDVLGIIPRRLLYPVNLTRMQNRP